MAAEAPKFDCLSETCEAIRQIAETGCAPGTHHPALGCSIEWPGK